MKAIFENIIAQYEDRSLKTKQDILYEKMMRYDLDFCSHIHSMTIKKYNKNRLVLSPQNKSLEEITLKYLKRRLDSEFNIDYPNRKKIMREVFGTVEALHKMSDFVIFKFDFEDFFESVSSKAVFDNYIYYSNLPRTEKDILLCFIDEYKKCFAGIPISNSLIEIISREFDKKVKSIFHGYGLIIYSRYVDDVLMIFNKKISKNFLIDTVNKVIDEVFGDSYVKLNPQKTIYYTRRLHNIKFTYLGYEFNRTGEKFQYGISQEKIEKYRKRLEDIVLDYKENENLELLRQRLLFFASRVVFYNNFNSKYSRQANWDVVGIISNYSELRYFFGGDRITKSTKNFLEHDIIRTVKGELNELPYFLKGRNDSYQLINRFKKNKSIVFHSNIGWSQSHLIKVIQKIDPSVIYYKMSYRKLVKKYCALLKV